MFLLLFNQFSSHRLHGLKVPGESVILRLEEQMKIAKKVLSLFLIETL